MCELDFGEQLDLNREAGGQFVDAYRGPCVAAGVAEDLDEQLGCAVSDGWLLVEVGRAVDERADAHQLLDGIERVDDGEQRREAIQGAHACRVAALVDVEAVAELAFDVALGAARDLAGGVHEVADASGWHVVGQWRAGRRQADAELTQAIVDAAHRRPIVPGGQCVEIAHRQASEMVLARTPLIAFVATASPERARRFYADVLGLPLRGEDDFALVLDANGTMLRVVRLDHVAPVERTVLGWQVEDVQSTVRELADRGVAFERYAFMTQDELGIWTTPDGARVAWFKDPDGNLLSLTQLA